MKYIVVELFTDQFSVVVFSADLNHAAMVPSNWDQSLVRSAGFCRIMAGEIDPTEKELERGIIDPQIKLVVSCWGKSVSLNKENHADDESLILKELKRWDRY